jgi:N-methylhydantoinase B
MSARPSPISSIETWTAARSPFTSSQHPATIGADPQLYKGRQGAFRGAWRRVPPRRRHIHNDPYGGASHGPDVAFCLPVFDGETLLGFSVTTAHHLDIGAHTPGSCGIVDAFDSYAEGLQLKALKIVDQGRPNAMLWHMIHDNIRIS